MALIVALLAPVTLLASQAAPAVAADRSAPSSAAVPGAEGSPRRPALRYPVEPTGCGAAYTRCLRGSARRPGRTANRWFHQGKIARTPRIILTRSQKSSIRSQLRRKGLIPPVRSRAESARVTARRYAFSGFGDWLRTVQHRAKCGFGIYRSQATWRLHCVKGARIYRGEQIAIKCGGLAIIAGGTAAISGGTSVGIVAAGGGGATACGFAEAHQRIFR